MIIWRFFPDTWEDHIKNLETVLKRIREAKLKINAAKCQFAQKIVKYRGRAAGEGRYKPAEAKILAIVELLAP